MKQMVLAVLAAVLALCIFIAQGPYKKGWQYVLPFVPLAMAGTGIAVWRIISAFSRLRAALALAKHKYELIVATRVSSHMVVQVQNTDGDAEYRASYDFDVVKGGVPINLLKREHIYASMPLTDLPADAEVTSTTVAGLSLSSEDFHHNTTLVDGRTLHHYSWSYAPTPVLNKKGQKFRYRYKVLIPKCEANAFTEDGCRFIVEHGVVHMEKDACLIAPPSHKITVIECHLEDSDGTKVALHNRDMPSLSADGSVLTWHPRYCHGGRYVCHYCMIRV